jgi:hypothetical protein
MRAHFYVPARGPRRETARERCKRCGLERRTVGVLEPNWNRIGDGFPILRTLRLYRPKGGAAWSTLNDHPCTAVPS